MAGQAFTDFGACQGQAKRHDSTQKHFGTWFFYRMGLIFLQSNGTHANLLFYWAIAGFEFEVIGYTQGVFGGGYFSTDAKKTNQRLNRDCYDLLEKKCKHLYGCKFITCLNKQVPRRHDWHGNAESGQGEGKAAPFITRGVGCSDFRKS